MKALVLALTLTAAPVSAGHPAPLGPQRPAERGVAGPTNIDEGTATVTPTAGTRRGVEITFDATRRTLSGEKPAAPREFVFLFDNSIRLNPTAFPTCTRAVLAEQGPTACPTGSLVGTGSVDFYPTGTAEVAVYNTRYTNGWRGVLITIPATGTILENTLEPVAPAYQRDYTWAMHEIVPPDGTPPETRGSTTKFRVTFGATTHGRAFVESHASPGQPLSIGVWSHYVTGQTTLVAGEVTRPGVIQ